MSSFIDNAFVAVISFLAVAVPLVLGCVLAAALALVALWVVRFLVHITIDGVRFAVHHLVRTATGPHVCAIHPAPAAKATTPLDHLLTAAIPVQRAVPTDTTRLARVDVLA